MNDDKLIEGKYRVFHGTADPTVDVQAFYANRNGEFDLEEVTDFVFVLRPDVDEAAKVALAAYAAAVAPKKPGLAADLWSQMSEWYDSPPYAEEEEG